VVQCDVPSSALMLLVGQEEAHAACNKLSDSTGQRAIRHVLLLLLL